jgi:hypothetical protein
MPAAVHGSQARDAKKIAISETTLLWWSLGYGDGGTELQPRLSQDREEFEEK